MDRPSVHIAQAILELRRLAARERDDMVQARLIVYGEVLQNVVIRVEAIEKEIGL